MPPSQTAMLKLDPALLQRLKGIEPRSRFLVRGLYSSRHRTSEFGPSAEFMEHREYRWGDDLRRIDWRVFARTDRYFVKLNELESEMSVRIFLDTSDSMRVPPPEGLPTKLELAAMIAGAVSVMAQAQQDSVGIFCLAEKIEEHIPPKQGQVHLATLFQHLEEPSGSGGNDFGVLLLEAGKRSSTRGLAICLTDALDNTETLANAMKNLRVREHDVTLIQILDLNELEFPFDRMTEFRHPETSRRLVGDPAALRTRYLERLHAHLEHVEAACRSAQADFLRLHNADDLARLLSLHFIRRLMRMRRGC